MNAEAFATWEERKEKKKDKATQKNGKQNSLI